MGVAADGFSELGADEHEGVLPVVALLVEGLGAETVLGGPEQPLHPLYLLLLTEDLAKEEVLVLHNILKQKLNSAFPES